MKEVKNMAEAKYMGEVVPFCPNCGRKIESVAGGPTILKVGEVINFFKARVDRVKTHTYPEDRQIGVKKIRITKLFTHGKNKGKKTKPKFLEKPIIETIQKTDIMCGLCGSEIKKKALLSKFGMTVGNDGQLIKTESALKSLTEVPQEERPKPEGA